MALGVDLSILNQRGTPAFFSDIFANRPTFGFAGRVFISTDTGAIYEDTGTAWTLIADAGAGTTGTLQQVTTNGNTTTQGISITAGGLSSNSITNTSLTTGSVAFVGAAGLMTQDNANFFWDDTNNRLGLGTITPTAKLDIHGSGAMALFNGTGANNGYIGFQNAGSTKWTIGNQYTGVVNNFQIINRLGNSVFSITGDQQANFEYNVTIKQALNLNNVDDQLRISSGTIDAAIHTYSASNLMYIGATSSTTLGFNIDLSNGGIGIGTTTPLSKLQVVDTGTVMRIGESSGTTGKQMLFGVDSATGRGEIQAVWQGTANTPLGLNVAGGNVLVGTTTDNGNKLQVNGTATFASSMSATQGSFSLATVGGAIGSVKNLTVSNSNGDVGDWAGLNFAYYNNTTNFGYIGTVVTSGASNAAADMVFGVKASNAATTVTEYMRIAVGGATTITNLAGTGSRAVLADANGLLSAPVSDITVKENIKPIEYGLSEILKMKPVWFDFIDEYKNYGQGRQNGNIAQDMEQIIPEAVFTTPSTNKMGINYDQLHAIYIKAIQELNDKLIRNNIN